MAFFSSCFLRFSSVFFWFSFGFGKPWGQSAKARYTPAGSGRMKPGEVAFFFSLYKKNRWPWYLVLAIALHSHVDFTGIRTRDRAISRHVGKIFFLPNLLFYRLYLKILVTLG